MTDKYGNVISWFCFCTGIVRVVVVVWVVYCTESGIVRVVVVVHYWLID